MTASTITPFSTAVVLEVLKTPLGIFPIRHKIIYFCDVKPIHGSHMVKPVLICGGYIVK